MTGIALRGLATRKLRSVMVAFAVVLGVAMIAGSLVLTDTIRSAFTGIYDKATQSSDAVVSAKTVVEFSNSGDPSLPAALLETVARVPGVATAAGGIADDSGARLTDATGTPTRLTGAPTLALGFNPADAKFSGMRLEKGRWANGPEEVVIDAASLDRLAHTLGGTVQIVGRSETRTFRIVGTATIGGSSKLGGATVAAFDLATAQAFTGRTSLVDEIHVAGNGQVTQDELARRISEVLPPEAQVRTQTEERAAEISEVDEGLGVIRQFLLAFAGIALFVGAFVIFNTLSITVAQRTRELATMRLIGASTRQIRRSVVAEGAIIGIVGSIVGLLTGIVLAKGLNAAFAAAGVDLPTAGTVVQTRTIVVSLVVGTLVTVLASLAPAIRATRIAPTAAVREGLPTSSSQRSRRRSGVVAGAGAAAGAALVSVALFVDPLETRPRLLTLAFGLVFVFLGIGMLLPRLVAPIAQVVGIPSARVFGEAGRLGRDNAVRNPGRTAATAAALMVGLALIASVAVLGAGLRESDRNALTGQVGGTHVVSSEDGFSTLPTSVGRRVAAAEGVGASTSLRQDVALSQEGEVIVTGIDPGTIEGLVTISGGAMQALTALADGQAVVSAEYAKDRDLTVGDRTSITTPTGSELSTQVVGVYEPSRFDSLLGAVVVTHETFDRSFSRPSDALTLVSMTGDATASTAALERALATTPTAVVDTTDAWIDRRTEALDQVLGLLYVLLGLSVCIALLGMVNTIALSVLERTREIGMLRAVGASRRQIRRMVRHESVVIALIGTAVGLPLGVGLAWLVTQALGDYDVSLALPVGSLITIGLVAVVLAVVAASGPARRAARVNVVDALATT